MASALKKISLAKNEVIFREGDPAETMYKVSFGLVEIYINYKQSGQKLLATISNGEVFGEMALIDDTTRSATAVAASNDVSLVAISRDSLNDLVKDDMDFVRDLFSRMSTNLRDLTANYKEACRVIADYKAAADAGLPLSRELKSDIDRIGGLYKNNH